MMKLVYVCLLIFCTIFFHETGTSTGETIEKSSQLHVRQKRVINRLPFGNTPQWIPYIVQIRKNGQLFCGGSILAPDVILTAARCFIDRAATYKVISGSVHIGGQVRHNITYTLPFPYFDSNRRKGDLALILIDPVIDLVNSPNRQITLYNGSVEANISAYFSGWGCTHLAQNSLTVPCELRVIFVPIIREDRCQRFYPRGKISKENICTLDRDGKMYGTSSDIGGPLIVANELAGVYSWSGKNHRTRNPDVFMNMVDSVYRDWVRVNLELISGCI